MIYPCDKNSVAKAVSILKRGEIIIYPTDTLYGFGVDATNSKAIKSLNLLKNRSDPLSIILSSCNQIKNYGKLTKENKKLVNKILPGPFTILINSIKSNLSQLVYESSKYIGIRVPNHSFPIKIVEMLGCPIVTTSVNKKNQTPLNDISIIEKAFPEVNIFKDKINIDSKGSTIINLTLNPYKIIRDGDGVL